jgi:hypothetical protein
MIGIKDTLEINAALHGNSDRLADRIFGRKKGQNWHRQPPAAAKVNPLRRYTRSTFSGLFSGMEPGQNVQKRVNAA